MRRACDCCTLLDGDRSIKEVGYCEICGAYLCRRCEDDWTRRTSAFLRKKGMDPDSILAKIKARFGGK